MDILRSVRDEVRRKVSEEGRANSWFLLQDHSKAHRSALVKDFLTRNNVTTLDHPPQSLGLELELLLRLQSAMKGRSL
jgi:hypothetical protein